MIKTIKKRQKLFVLLIFMLILFLFPSVTAESPLESCELTNSAGFDFESCEYELILKEELIVPVQERPNYEVKPFQNSEDFISVWDVDDSLTINLPLVENGVYNFTVNGDNLANNITITNHSDNVISFTSANISQISISGTIEGWSFNDSSDASKILEISNWGNLSLGDTKSQFRGTNNLVITANDTPNLSNTNSFANIFSESDIHVFNNSNSWNTTTIQNMTWAFDESNFNSPINDWDVSNVRDMSVMFYNTDFDQNISLWNTSNVEDMSFMFWGNNEFNQDLSSWDVNKVTTMTAMFYNARKFDQDISMWNVSNVEYFNFMFYRAFDFDQPIELWDTRSALNMRAMFYDTSFNRDISSWNTTNVNSMSIMFYDTNFDQPIGSWEVGNVETMERMFYLSDFNQNLSAWNTSSLENTQYMFTGTPFNNAGDAGINNWDVGNLADALGMFAAATSFNQPLGDWELLSLVEARGLFANSAFNQNISTWNVSQLTSAGFFFQNAPFAYDINDWDVSNVEDFDGFFWGAEKFNHPLDKWNVSSAVTAEGMFFGAQSFDQDISMWDVSNIDSFDGSSSMFLENSNFSTGNYDKLLFNWKDLDLQSAIDFGAPNTTYCLGEIGKQEIMDDFSWSFNDSGLDAGCAKPFISVWDTSLSGDTNNTQILLPLEESGTYNFTVVAENLTGGFVIVDDYQDNLLEFDSEGVQEIYVYGELDGWRFNGEGDANKIIEIKQWGNISLGTGGQYFRGASNLRDITALDSPNLESTTSFDSAFRNADLSEEVYLNHWNTSTITSFAYMFSESNVNTPLNGWDTSNVVDIQRMFYRAFNFNQDLDKWDTGKITDMHSTFDRAYDFNSNITTWDTGNVTDMRLMFNWARDFNQDISGWDTSKVTDMAWMFRNVDGFNQPIGSWNTSSVTDMKWMFWSADDFNQPLNDWDVSNIDAMDSMFRTTSFNQSLNDWDVSGVHSMEFAFADSPFNGNVSGWDVSNVRNFDFTFRSTSFNQNVSGWDVSSAESMIQMFAFSDFDQDVSGWDVSNVEDMFALFYGTPFNQDVSEWNISNVNDIRYIFGQNPAFNQDVSGWDVSHLNNLDYVFWNATSFNQNLGAWNVSNVGSFVNFLSDSNVSYENYDVLLSSWQDLNLNLNISFDAANVKYGPGGEVARQNITDNYNWSFSDGGLVNLTPKSSKFNGSTGFNSSRLDNTSLVLEVENKGRISWVGSLDVRLADFDSNVEISDNRVFVNSSRLGSQFNSSAILTFYNISWDNPEVLRNGVVCDSCEILSYSNGVLEVRVPGFSTYTTREGEEEEPRRSVRSSKTGGENISISEEDLIQGKTVEAHRLQNIILDTARSVRFYVDRFATSYVTANVDDELIQFNESDTSMIRMVDGNLSVTYMGRNLSKFILAFQWVGDENDAEEDVVEEIQFLNVGNNSITVGNAKLNISKDYDLEISIDDRVDISSEALNFNISLGTNESRAIAYNTTNVLVFEVENIEGDTADLFLRLEEKEVDVQITAQNSLNWLYAIMGIFFLVVLFGIYLRRKT